MIITLAIIAIYSSDDAADAASISSRYADAYFTPHLLMLPFIFEFCHYALPPPPDAFSLRLRFSP